MPDRHANPMLTSGLPDAASRARSMRPKAQRARASWFRIQNAKGKDGEAEILIYDVIDSWYGVSAKDFVNELRALDVEKITVRINSPGGDAFDGVAIYNALKSHSAHVVCQVDGIAASAASFIAMAGDEVVMAAHATLMIHDAWGFAMGNAQEMRDVAEILDKLSDNIAGIYADRAGGTVSAWRDAMKAETWYSDREAVDAGLADRVAGDEDEDAEQSKNRFDLSVFRHPPEDLLKGTAPPPGQGGGQEPTKREAERALRDAGLSHSRAKAIVAAGWGARDGQARTPGPRDAVDLSPLRDVVEAFTTATKTQE